MPLDTTTTTQPRRATITSTSSSDDGGATRSVTLTTDIDGDSVATCTSITSSETPVPNSPIYVGSLALRSMAAALIDHAEAIELYEATYTTADDAAAAPELDTEA